MRLVALCNPVGDVIEALLAAYNAIQFLADNLRHIGQLVETLSGALGRIARGDTGPAGDTIYASLKQAVPLLLDFVAKQVGLTGVGAAIGQALARVKAFIAGIEAKVVGLIAAEVKRLAPLLHLPGHGSSPGGPHAPGASGAPGTGLSLQQQLDHVMAAALHALAKYSGKRERASDLQPVLDNVKQSTPYNGYKIQALKPVADPDKEHWDIYGEINPRASRRTFILVDRSTIQPAGPYSSRYTVVENGKHMLKPEYRIKAFTRDACYGKSYRDDINQWKRRLLNTDYTGDPTMGLRNPQNHNQYWHNGQYYTNAGTTIATIDHQPMIVQHWNTTGHNTNQDTRRDYFNGHGITLTIVPLTLNSADGASAGHEYTYEVGPNFRGPRE